MWKTMPLVSSTRGLLKFQAWNCFVEWKKYLLWDQILGWSRQKSICQTKKQRWHEDSDHQFETFWRYRWELFCFSWVILILYEKVKNVFHSVSVFWIESNSARNHFDFKLTTETQEINLSISRKTFCWTGVSFSFFTRNWVFAYFPIHVFFLKIYLLTEASKTLLVRGWRWLKKTANFIPCGDISHWVIDSLWFDCFWPSVYFSSRLLTFFKRPAKNVRGRLSCRDRMKTMSSFWINLTQQSALVKQSVDYKISLKNCILTRSNSFYNAVLFWSFW